MDDINKVVEAQLHSEGKDVFAVIEENEALKAKLAALVKLAFEVIDWGTPELPGANDNEQDRFDADWKALRKALENEQ